MAISAYMRAFKIRREFLAALSRRTPEVLHDLVETVAPLPALSVHNHAAIDAAYRVAFEGWRRRSHLGMGGWLFGAAYDTINTMMAEFNVVPSSDLELFNLELGLHARERTRVDFDRGFTPPKRQAHYRAISPQILAWKTDVAVLRQVRGLTATRIAELLIDGDQEYPHIRAAHLEICGWCDIEPRQIPAYRPRKDGTEKRTINAAR